MRKEFEKEWDAAWERVMESTDGRKIGRAIYEAMQKVGIEFNPQNRPNLPWVELPIKEKELFADVVEELFQKQVIESGHALPNLYNQAGNSETQA